MPIGLLSEMIRSGSPTRQSGTLYPPGTSDDLEPDPNRPGLTLEAASCKRRWEAGRMCERGRRIVCVVGQAFQRDVGLESLTYIAP